MARLFLLVIGILMALGPPAAAQDQGALVSENHEVDAAEALCEAGDAEACATTGRHYEFGFYRPQIRPIAELLYREACDAAHARACHWLANLSRSLRQSDVSVAEAGLMLERACRLGELDACETRANWLVEAAAAGAPEKMQAVAIRRDLCEIGRASACLALAEMLTTDDRTAAEKSEGLGLLSRYCRTGDPEACRRAAIYLSAGGAGTKAQALTYHALGCELEDPSACFDMEAIAASEGEGSAARTVVLALYNRTCKSTPSACLRLAGLLTESDSAVEQSEGRRLLDQSCSAGQSDACSELGKITMRAGDRLEARTRALVFYDKACALQDYLCSVSIGIREETLLVPRCDRGEEAACISLGQLYYAGPVPIADREQAVALLGRACEAGWNEACHDAAEAIYGREAENELTEKQKAEDYLARSCSAGLAGGCDSLAYRFLFGEQIIHNLPRALPLLAAACDGGGKLPCQALEKATLIDPAAPLMLVGDDFGPALEPEELAAIDQEMQKEAERSDCIRSEAIFRGEAYSDLNCEPRPASRGGFAVRRSDAPWQALLWRPSVFKSQQLLPGQRVLCGGAVIREGWILTAAHCLTDLNQSVMDAGHTIRLGVYNPQANEGFTFPIIKAISHPQFNPKTYAFDIALVQYDRRAGQKGESVKSIGRIRLDPQPLAQREIRAGSTVFTYGWGRTEVDDPATPDHLRGVKLALSDAKACAKITRFRGQQEGAVLCAAGPQGQQACSGDSGGPLVTYGDPGGVPTVIGVVSAGVKCGTTGVPSRYTRVAKVSRWISQVLAGEP